MFEASHLPLFAESRIGAYPRRPPRVLLASHTLSARIFEVQNADAVANFPAALHLGANFHDFASRFMRRNHWQSCWKLPLQDLEVRMTKSRSIYLHEEIMLAASRYEALTELVGLVELHPRSEVLPIASMTSHYLNDLRSSHLPSHNNERFEQNEVLKDCDDAIPDNMLTLVSCPRCGCWIARPNSAVCVGVSWDEKRSWSADSASAMPSQRGGTTD